MKAQQKNEERQLPFDIDVEQALLGAILVDNYCFERVADRLRPEDFYDPLHERMFRAMINYHQRNRAITPITLAAAFHNDEGFTTVGGQAYLKSLANASPAIPNVIDYAKILQDFSGRRALIRIAEELVTAAFSPEIEDTPAIIADRAAEALYEQTRGTEHGRGPLPVIDLAHEAIAQSAKAMEAPESVCLTTGLRTIDGALGGIYRQDVTYLGGAPNMGKSGLLDLMVQANAVRGLPCVLFSLEMSDVQQATRYVSRASEISSDKIRKGELSDQELYRLNLAPGIIGDIQLRIDGTPNLTVAQIRARAQSLRRRYGALAMIGIDHLRFIKPADMRAREPEQIQQVTKDLKTMAKELDVAVVCIAHLNRDYAKRDSKRPQLQDLYGSAAIEQNADAVWFVHREHYYLTRAPADESRIDEYAAWVKACEASNGQAEVYSSKQRMGACASATVRFEAKLVRFYDPEEDAGNSAPTQMDFTALVAS
jgi:replicative DNA helicase